MARTVDIARTIKRQGAPVAHLVQQNGQAWSLHFTSEQAQVSGLGWSYASIARQGRKPLIRRDTQQVRTLTFSHALAAMTKEDDWRLPSDRGWNPTIALRELMGIADRGEPVRLINVTSDIESRGWWLPSLTVTIVARDERQQVKLAQLDWTMTEANDERPKIARTPPPPPPPRPPAQATPAASMQSDYTVVSGDSLWKIATRLLGSGPRWKEIYDLNQARLNLKPPEIYRGLLTVWIYPGQVLRIPAR